MFHWEQDELGLNNIIIIAQSGYNVLHKDWGSQEV